MNSDFIILDSSKTPIITKFFIQNSARGGNLAAESAANVNVSARGKTWLYYLSVLRENMVVHLYHQQKRKTVRTDS